VVPTRSPGEVVHVATSVADALIRVVLRCNGLGASGRPRVHPHQLTTTVETHRLRVGASAEPLPTQLVRQTVESALDHAEEVGADLRIRPGRNVERRGRRGEQVLALLVLKVLTRQAARGAVTSHAVAVPAPALGEQARVGDRGDDLASEAVVSHVAHGALDAGL